MSCNLRLLVVVDLAQGELFLSRCCCCCWRCCCCCCVKTSLQINGTYQRYRSEGAGETKGRRYLSWTAFLPTVGMGKLNFKMFAMINRPSENVCTVVVDLRKPLYHYFGSLFVTRVFNVRSLHVDTFSKLLRWLEPINVITLKTQQRAVNAFWNRVSQIGLIELKISVKLVFA